MGITQLWWKLCITRVENKRHADLAADVGLRNAETGGEMAGRAPKCCSLRLLSVARISSYLLLFQYLMLVRPQSLFKEVEEGLAVTVHRLGRSHSAAPLFDQHLGFE